MKTSFVCTHTHTHNLYAQKYASSVHLTYEFVCADAISSLRNAPKKNKNASKMTKSALSKILFSSFFDIITLNKVFY